MKTVSLLMRNVRRIHVVCAAAMVCFAAMVFGACTPDGNLRIGPVAIIVPAGEGMLLRDIFLPKITITHSEEFCDMPSESDLAVVIGQEGGIDLSRFIRISDLDLVQTVITATSNDFSFFTDMTVRFVPAPVDGQAQTPVVLGTASDPNGFGTEIVLVPSAPVDFIELFQMNDANTSGECPEIELQVTASGVPLNDVGYQVEIYINAYAEVGNN